MKTYNEYIAENLDKSIKYSEYIAKNLDINYSVGPIGPSGISAKEQKQKLRKKKMKNILDDELSDVINMTEMFNNCSSLITIDDECFSSGYTFVSTVYQSGSTIAELNLEEEEIITLIDKIKTNINAK